MCRERLGFDALDAAGFFYRKLTAGASGRHQELPSMKLSKLLPLIILSFTPLLSAHEPEWIWHTKQAADGEVRFFRKEFTLEALPAKAKLSASCDNEEIVYVNGREVGQSTEWKQPVVADIAKLLRRHGVILRRDQEHRLGRGVHPGDGRVSLQDSAIRIAWSGRIGRAAIGRYTADEPRDGVEHIGPVIETIVSFGQPNSPLVTDTTGHQFGTRRTHPHP